jgi:hypothetical protein
MFKFLSEDPLISSLRLHGYSVVTLPRANVKPLQVLTRNDNYFYKVGEFTTVFKAKSNIDVPKVKENVEAVDLSGKRSSEFSLDVGLTLVGNIISAFGGSPLGLDNAYSHSKTISFAYEDVLENRIEMSELRQFLNDAEINPFSPHTSELLESDEVYLITSTIKSKKITVYPTASTVTTLKDSITTIQGIVGANIKVTNTGQDPPAMMFESSIPLVLGFKAIQIFYREGRYEMQELPSSDISMRQEPNKNTISPITAGPFVRLITDDINRKAAPIIEYEKPHHLLLDLDERLMEKRFEAYGELLSLLEVLAKYNPVPVKYETIRNLSKNLQEWFFRKRGDLVLSPKSYPLYHNLQREIHAISGFNERDGILPDEDKSSITKRSSELRASMRDDLHKKPFSTD